MSKAADKSRPIPFDFKTDAPCDARAVFPIIATLVSLREELRARKDTVERAKQLPVLPVYVGRDPRNGKLFFRLSPRSRKRPLPGDPSTAEFSSAYHAYLLDAGENNDLDDWSEMRAFHAAQRVAVRKAAKHGGQR
jgi:hypothetical protein